ncbi:MAG: hypothetical protein OER77_02840 [Myxococcales bacterium]|nr:hypothetical protein [Myxococcales bacterium]
MRIFIMTLMLLALACSKKETSEPEQAGATEAPSSTGDSPQTDEPAVAEALAEPPPLPPALLQAATPPLDAPPVIAILDQGAEPRQALRWQLKSGFEQKAQIKVGFTVKAVVMTLAVGDPDYVVTFDLTQRVQKVDPDGTLRVSVSVDDATMHPAVLKGDRRAEQFKEALSAVKGSTGSYTMHPRGHVQDARIDMAAKKASRRAHDMLDNLRWALVQGTPTFPEEPIGPGAKWTVNRSALLSGMLVNQLTTLELVKRAGPQLVLKIGARQTAEKQPFTSPGTLEEMKLLTLNGVGAGTATWELTQLTPRSADIEANVLKGVQQEVGRKGEKKRVQTAIGTTRTLLIEAD